MLWVEYCGRRIAVNLHTHELRCVRHHDQLGTRTYECARPFNSCVEAGRRHRRLYGQVSSSVRHAGPDCSSDGCNRIGDGTNSVRRQIPTVRFTAPLMFESINLCFQTSARPRLPTLQVRHCAECAWDFHRRRLVCDNRQIDGRGNALDVLNCRVRESGPISGRPNRKFAVPPAPRTTKSKPAGFGIAHGHCVVHAWPSHIVDRQRVPWTAQQGARMILSDTSERAHPRRRIPVELVIGQFVR